MASRKALPTAATDEAPALDSRPSAEHLEQLAATIASGYAVIHMPVDQIAINSVALAQEISRRVRKLEGSGVPAMAMVGSAATHPYRDEESDDIEP